MEAQTVGAIRGAPDDKLSKTREEALEILAIYERARRRGIRLRILRWTGRVALFAAGAIVGGLLVAYYPELSQFVLGM